MSPAVTFRSKKEFVYGTLRAQILSGELAPNARLIIDELSRGMNVSAIPVREALQQLQSEGLVQIEPYVGARVSDIHQGFIEEIFGLLEAFEVVSGRSAAMRMSTEHFEQLERLVRRMDDEVSDPERWSQSNIELHQFICECVNMQLIKTQLTLVVEHWNRLRRHYLDDVFAARIHFAQQEHWRLLDALRTRNPDHVAQVIQEHNRQALDSYLKYLDSANNK
ncbi:MAG: GntR family transcriptional regulator [Caldilineaceae bacterium]|nr:GntR family transcriptional regulator [Caldilineaceae bacterium]MCB0098772.1 GntR family transcriptional regulator [Caldilineaceae bacterium]MCB0141713.1 GntR family transcriptional regulator [Caldilineaceae bacterium]